MRKIMAYLFPNGKFGRTIIRLKTKKGELRFHFPSKAGYWDGLLTLQPSFFGFSSGSVENFWIFGVKQQPLTVLKRRLNDKNKLSNLPWIKNF